MSSINRRIKVFDRIRKREDIPEKKKTTRRKRETTLNFSAFQEIGREFFNRILQILIVTVVTTIVYWITGFRYKYENPG